MKGGMTILPPAPPSHNLRTGTYEFANPIKSGPASLGVLGVKTIVMLEYY